MNLSTPEGILEVMTLSGILYLRRTSGALSVSVVHSLVVEKLINICDTSILEDPTFLMYAE